MSSKKTAEEQADVFKIIAIVGFVSIACYGVFLLPFEIQNMFKVRYAVFNPLTFITASFVHGNAEHLINNLSIFALFAFLLYFLNKKSGNMRFFFYSLLILFVVLPLLNYSLLFFSGIYSNREFGFGLSLVDSGLIGLTIPSLMLFFRTRLTKFNLMLFFFSMVFLSFFSISLFYASSNQPVILIVCLVFGLGFGMFEFRKILKFIAESLKRKATWAESILVMASLSFFFGSLVGLFPSNVVFQTGITDIITHYIGLLFGIGFFSLYGFLHKKIM